nr:PREDICTED: leucine-rich repeat-containing protein 34 [Latimeria chalumnae]|eukprot:XP_014342010.1 PREDICTED: leucine-rich repeat-containing protein 34 [Latimeria chalumnae]
MCNDITTIGAEVIAKALHWNQTLKQLRMNGNKIGNKGGMYFAAMLQVNSSLEELDLGDCDLGTQSVVALSTVLNNNVAIKSINLSRPLLFSQQEETTVHLAKMLKVNKHLEELHLEKHDMKEFGAERLSETLVENFTLRYLDLSCNRITRDGTKCLAQLLKHNTSLEILDLSANRIEDDGALYLSEAIAFHNTNLKALAVLSNNIGGKGLVALADAMKRNTTLACIYIWGNKFDEATCSAFLELIHSGRLKQDHTDVRPYVVDGHACLAELFHGLRKHYYWTPSSRQDGELCSNYGLTVRAKSSESKK